MQTVMCIVLADEQLVFLACYIVLFWACPRGSKCITEMVISLTTDDLILKLPMQFHISVTTIRTWLLSEIANRGYIPNMPFAQCAGLHLSNIPIIGGGNDIARKHVEFG